MLIKLLSDEQIMKIHQSSLKILEFTGIVVPHLEIPERFSDSGAKVDFKEERVWIPADLVMKSIASAGKHFTIYGRDIQKTARFGQGTRNYNSSAGQFSWLDHIGGMRRAATLDDAIKATRVGDALNSINIVGPMSDPHEIPVEYRCVAVAAEMMKNTSKPLTFWFYDRITARFLVDMLIAIRGNQRKAEEFPMFYPFFEPISPLHFPFHGIDLLFETARINLPVPIGPMAQMGLSAPGTIAGTLTQQNAEILAGVCISQLIRPGMPICYGGTCHAFDMKTTQLLFGGPEQAIFGIAMTQMGKHYGFPVYINEGLTDSKRPDAQAGLEIGITLALGAAAGADIFGHMGICGVDQAASLDILVLQNEIIAYVESNMREIDFSDESLGIDEISEVGPGGTFIDRIHTACHFRRELWFPQLLDRNYYQQWIDQGASSTEERCLKHKNELSTYSPEPISEELDRILDGIVEEAKQFIRKG